MEPSQNNTPSSSGAKKVGIGIAVAAVAALVGITAFAGKNTAPEAVTPVTDTTTQTAAVATTPATAPGKTTGQTTDKNKVAASVYTDGTYTATGSYMSPGGLDHVDVTLTLKNDIVTDASVTPKPGDNTSARYQAMFVAGYKQYVVGKNITTVHVDKVSGSSLTGKGFNDAVLQIEAQAKA